MRFKGRPHHEGMKTNTTTLSALILAATTLAIAPTAAAHPPAPPEEAFAACAGKNKGDACGVTIHDRTIEGTCAEPPPGVSDTRLACRPNGPPPGPPPSER